MSFAIVHPDIDAIAYAESNDQFLQVHRPRGWERLPAEEQYASEQLGRVVRKLDDLKVDELLALAAGRGSGEEVPRNAKKADHVAAYKATFADGFEPVIPTPEEDVAPSAPAPQELAAAPAS